ncbi:MAG TPA: helix-turn-helix domain-containing protein, partial [Terriglobales bacterium]
EDITLLVEHFIKKFCEENEKPLVQMSPGALHALMDYNFPGNVRELENVMERAVVLSSGSTITPDLLPDNIVGHNSTLSMIGSRPDASLFDIMEDAERRIIGEMLEKCAWNQTEAAKRFRIPLSTLNQKIKRLGIELEKRTIRENPA